MKKLIGIVVVKVVVKVVVVLMLLAYVEMGKRTANEWENIY